MYGPHPTGLGIIDGLQVLRQILVDNVRIGLGDYVFSVVRVLKVVDHWRVEDQPPFSTRST